MQNQLVVRTDAIAYLPGAYIQLSLDNSLRLWDVETSSCLQMFAGHRNGVRLNGDLPLAFLAARRIELRSDRLLTFKHLAFLVRFVPIGLDRPQSITLGH